MLAGVMIGEVTLLRLEDGEIITKRERRDVVILAERPELTITWSRYVSGERGPDPHVHREHTDAFYVLEGELTFAVGSHGEPIRMGPGGFVAVPPNVIHSFANEGRVDASWLNLHAPDKRFAAYLRAARDGTEVVGFDSFDPPADGGLPAAEAIVTGPGEGERLAIDALIKGVLPELCLVEWASEPLERAAAGAGHTFAHGARVVEVCAPDGGFADSLRG